MLTYDDQTHTYAWNGLPIPSLSRYMKDLGWSREEDLSWITANRPSVLELARIRGKQVHEAIDRYLSKDPNFADSLSEASAPYFDSFLGAADELPLTDDGEGELVAGGWCGYGTTLDRIEPEAIIEWKATAKVHPSTYIQMAGQALAAKRDKAVSRIVVHLQKTGKKAKILVDRNPSYTYDLWEWSIKSSLWKREMKWS